MAGFSYLCILLLASSQMIKAAPMEPVPDGNAKITKFHVNTYIQMRYATTNVETLVKNFANEVSEVFFDMYVPKEAFVSNFSMSLKGQTYVAKVDKKEEAEAKFNESAVSAGLIGEQKTPEFKEGKHVSYFKKNCDQTNKHTYIEYCLYLVTKVHR